MSSYSSSNLILTKSSSDMFKIFNYLVRPFYLKNAKILMFSGFKDYFSSVKINPTALNNLSDSTELQGILQLVY